MLVPPHVDQKYAHTTSGAPHTAHLILCMSVFFLWLTQLCQPVDIRMCVHPHIKKACTDRIEYVKQWIFNMKRHEFHYHWCSIPSTDHSHSTHTSVVLGLTGWNEQLHFMHASITQCFHETLAFTHTLCYCMTTHFLSSSACSRLTSPSSLSFTTACSVSLNTVSIREELTGTDYMLVVTLTL